jgi:hypothetical protein
MRGLAVRLMCDTLMATAGAAMLGAMLPVATASTESNRFSKAISAYGALAKSGGSPPPCVEESTGASGETILTLNSGRGCDWASTDDGASFSRVSASTPAHNYDTIPDTSWISGGSKEFASVIYSNAFELGCAFDEPSIEIQVHADNVASVYFNGALLGQQPFIEHEINFQDPPEVFSTSDRSLFQEGTNSVVINVYNFHTPAGVDYQATVTFYDLSVDCVYWEGVVESDDKTNLEPGNPHGGGLMFFAEKNTPTGPVHDKVVAVAKLGAPVPPGRFATVYFKVFDMDDPTHDHANDPTNIVDHNDTATEFKGDDNRCAGAGTCLGISPAGIQEVTVPAGSDTAEVVYTISAPQPGNNWKVVAHCQREFVEDVEVDDQYPAFGLNFRRISDPAKSVPARYQTELLSIWRTLWIERDWMKRIPDDHRESVARVFVAFPHDFVADFVIWGSEYDWSTPEPDLDEFEGGPLRFVLHDATGFGVLDTFTAGVGGLPFKIMKSPAKLGKGFTFWPELTQAQLDRMTQPDVAFVNAYFSDDDDYGLFDQPQLVDLGAVGDTAYGDAYMAIKNINTQSNNGLNAKPDRNWIRHLARTQFLFQLDDTRDVTSEPDFWVTQLVACHEPHPYISSLLGALFPSLRDEDLDPDPILNIDALGPKPKSIDEFQSVNEKGAPLYGLSGTVLSYGKNLSAVFLQVIGDEAGRAEGIQIQVIGSHEVGHTMGFWGVGHPAGDHLMNKLPSVFHQFRRFRADEINTLRETAKW